MGKKKAPQPEDPRNLASAQTGTNIGTAIANNTMGMVNQNTPYGSLNYQQTGTTKWTDPYTGRTYDLPSYTANTTLSPEEQAKLEQNQAAELSLARTAAERGRFLEGYLPGTEALTDQIDTKLFDLGRTRLDPRFAQEEEAMRTRLANSGIGVGSEAWNREMAALGQNKNDAYNSLALAGRGQALSEVNNPINQITALLSGSQVQNPNVAMSQPAQIPTTDVAGLMSQNYNQRLNAFNQNQQNRSSLLGGLFGAGAKLISGGLF